MARVEKITLRNGLRLVLVRQPSSLTATVLVLVETGSEYETKQINGISHFLEHLTFKGTTKRPRPGAIAEELAGLGAESNAFTSQEYTGYWAKAEAKKLPRVLDIISDLYLNPIFDGGEIEKERGVVIEEINMYEDTPAHRTHDIFMRLLYGNQPAGWDILGEKKIIKRLKREDFVEYREKHYVAPATTVCVAGNFDDKKITLLVRDLFGHLPRARKSTKPRTTVRQSRSRSLAKFKASDQSHLVLGVPALDIFDGRKHALQVLAEVLGGGMSSRLFRRIREELGAAYYVRATPEFCIDHGYLAVSAGVDHRRITPVIQAILEELRRLTHELVGAEELKRSKDHLEGSLVLNLETSDELASFYGGQEILTRKLLQPDTLVDKIQSVSAGAVREVARQFFRTNRLNLAVIGPYRNPKSFQKLLRL
ncbi:insulinase family protein [Candidatus Parcubacteria bacterium]|nr:MAG: insulinase family protein [Candidatus Parcubacteria bacterium]